MPKNATKRIIQGDGKHLAQGSKPVCRGGTSGKDSSKGGGGLYTVRFERKKALEVMSSISEFWDSESRYRVGLSLKNDLSTAYKRYCKLCGVTAREKELDAMYHHLNELVKKEHKGAYLNVEQNQDTGKYYFLIHRNYSYQLIVYSLPLYFLRILEERGSKLYEPMLQFCGWMVKKLGFTTWRGDNWMLEYAVDMAPERAEEFVDEDPQVALDIMADVNKYVHHNEASEMLHLLRVNGEMPDRSFVASLNRKKLNYKEDFYRRWILDGVKLMQDPDCRTVASMQCKWEFEEEYTKNGTPVDVDMQFVICWHSEDAVMSDYMGIINSHNSECSSYTPCEWLVVDNRTNKPYRASEWGHRLRDWLDRGLSVMDREVKMYIKKTEVSAKRIEVSI